MSTLRTTATSSRIVAALMLSGLIGGASARAEPPPADSESVDLLLEQVYTLRRAHEDAQALDKARQAYALRPIGSVLVQVALAEWALGRFAPAYIHLKKALSDQADPALAGVREPLSHGLFELEARVARLALQIEPRGAEVLIDGEVQSATQRAEDLVLEPGAVVIEVRAAGFAPHTERLRLTAGERVSRTLRLLPALATAPTPREQQPPPAPEPAASGPARYILAAGTGALVVGAAVTCILAGERASEFQAKNDDEGATYAERESLRTQAQTMQRVCSGLVIGAVIAGGVTAYVWLAEPGSESQGLPAGAMIGVRGRM